MAVRKTLYCKILFKKYYQLSNNNHQPSTNIYLYIYIPPFFLKKAFFNGSRSGGMRGAVECDY